MNMRLPTQNGQTLFTIEQIELLRRLRNSGLTKDQIGSAFENLDRIDRELGPVYSIPISQIANTATFQQIQAQAREMANQVASQLAHAAKAAQSGALGLGTQPVFPHPIAIAPLMSPHPHRSLAQTQGLSPSTLRNGNNSDGTGSQQSSPTGSQKNVNNNSCSPGVISDRSTTAKNGSNEHRSDAIFGSVSSPSVVTIAPTRSASPSPLTIVDSTCMSGRKRSLSSDTCDSALSNQSATGDSSNGAPQMVQVNGSVMVPAELTAPRRRLSPITHVIQPTGSLSNPPTPHNAPPPPPHLGAGLLSGPGLPISVSAAFAAAAAAHNNNLHPLAVMSPQNAVAVAALALHRAQTPSGGGGNGQPKAEFKFEGIPEISDNNEEYVTFLSKGERACCEEIKEFVQKYNIRQQQIATLSGMCQSYVSRFLRGEFFDMSGRSRQSIIKWYLAYKNCPNSIASAVSAVQMANGHPPAKRFISALDVNSGEFVNTPRRERFVFRPNHVLILEKYFNDDSYPSYEKREEIARTLNASTEASTGKPLEEREIVTAQIISNWFANKRKEMKKIAREEGLDVSQVPIRPRGRPSGRFFLSNMLPGGEQATDLSLGGMASLGERHLSASGLPHSHSELAFPTPIALSDIGGNHSMGATDLSLDSNLMEREENDNEFATDLSINGTTQPERSGSPINHGETRERDGNMSTPDLATQYDVELAAVNQAILSLTGQTPLAIKMEKPDSQSGKGIEA